MAIKSFSNRRSRVRGHKKQDKLTRKISKDRTNLKKEQRNIVFKFKKSKR
jgi:hypothetical protein